MRKTNFYSLQGFVFIALFVLSFIKVNAQQGIACQNHINASLSQNCSVDLSSIVNAAGPGVSIEVKNGTNALTQSALNTYNVATSQIVIGNIYTYELSNGSAKCWGTIKFEDKLAPQISCPTNEKITCTARYGYSTSEVEIVQGAAGPGQINIGVYIMDYSLGIPTVQECSAYKLFYSDTKSLACAPGSVGTVTRTFRAVDVNGNVATCTQIITIGSAPTPIQTPDNINLTVCPSNVNLADYTPSALFANPDQSIKNAAYPEFTSGDCMRSATYTDKVTSTVCGNKILRTWVVVDMCSGTLVTLTPNNQNATVQIISLSDDQAPAIPVGVKVPDEITIGTSALNCFAAQNVRFPGFVDNCNIVSRTLSVNGFSYTANANGWVNIFGLPIGSYTGIYNATDACGNVGQFEQEITVEDLMAPVAIADQNTNVSFTLDCTATVNATTFDDGSLDNCCLDVNRFEVKRMIELTDTVKYENLAGNRSFSDRITFVKEDLNGSCTNTVQVIFKVWDCYGNSNIAMVNVKLEDKIGPIAEGADTMVMCGNTASGTDWLNSWTSRLQGLTTLNYPPVFGTNPGYFDNCDATVTWSAIEGSIDQCNNGKMTRKATVKDKCDRSACATFTYNSGQQSQYKITLPRNTKYTCPGSTVPTKAQAISDARKTLVTISGCPVVAVDIKSEETLTATGGACYRIKRTWVVASLCHNGMQKGEFKDYDNAVMGNSTTDYTYESTFDGFNQLGKDAEDDKYVEYVQTIDVYDSEKPTISNAVAPTLLREGKCNLKLFIGGFDAADQCAAIVDKSWSLLDVNKNAIAIGTNPVTYAGGKSFPASYSFTSDDFGKKFYVRYKAEDRCGNIEVRDYLIEPSDVIKPTTVCYQGLSADLMPTTGEVWLSATMFDAGSSDGCKGDARNATLLPAVANAAPATNNRMFSADNTVELRIERASGTPLAFGTSVPATNMIWVGCTGIVPIRLWSIDAAGNTDYCDTYVQIQNNMNATPKEGVCPAVTVTGAKISGNVSTSNGKVLDNALVAITSGTAANGKVTSKVVNGKYEVFVANGSDVKVSADKNDNPLNGVSTFDLVLISKHILGTQMINDVYGKQAADINNNGKITTSDIVELRKMILGLQANYNNNKSWRFFDAKMNEEVVINNIQNDATIDFTAVKTGDINGNANAASAQRTMGTHEFTISDRNLNAGETVTLTLSGTEGFGFTMNYDAKSLEVLSVDANSAVLENGTITTAQVGSEFAVTFKATTATTLSNVISINSNVTTAEAVVNGELYNVALKFNNKANGFELFQNQPNPFRTITAISFNAPAAADYILTVTDIAGRVVSSTNGISVKGLNQVSLEMNNPGIYSYTITSGNFTATKKMIVME